MEPLLTNHCRMDKTTLQKAFTLISKRSRIVLFIGAGLMLALAILLTCLGNLDLITFILYVGSVVYLYLALRQTARLTKFQIQRFEENYQSDYLDTSVEFFPEEYQGRREGADAAGNRTKYAQIKRILESEEVIVIQTPARQFVILDRNRFEGGTEADFWRLMNEKCPSAVPKKYLQC